eukprot:06386.XXX_11812_11949_1 [CDS] Oithona nana genome sequencing.
MFRCSWKWYSSLLQQLLLLLGTKQRWTRTDHWLSIGMGYISCTFG